MHKIIESKTLINKFVNNLPKLHKIDINTQIINYKLKDKKIKWTWIQKCARLKDIQMEAEKKESEGQEEKEDEQEIIININRNDATAEQRKSDLKQNNENGDHKIYSFTEYHNQNRYGNYKYDRRGNNEGYRPYLSSRGGFRPKLNSPQMNFCDVCKRFGHPSQNCYYRIPSCYICRSSEHFIRDCPKNHNRNYSNRNYSMNFTNNQFNRRYQDSRDHNRRQQSVSPPSRRSYSSANFYNRNSINRTRQRSGSQPMHDNNGYGYDRDNTHANDVYNRDSRLGRRGNANFFRGRGSSTSFASRGEFNSVRDRNSENINGVNNNNTRRQSN